MYHIMISRNAVDTVYKYGLVMRVIGQNGCLPELPRVYIIQIWTGYEGNSTKYMPEGVRVDNYFTRP